MKTWLLSFFLLLGALSHLSATPAETFAAGNEAYHRRDFGEAIKTYETLLRRGETRAEIYYNLGLAYEKSANPAHAILSFERALLLSPGLSDAQIHRNALGDAPQHWWEHLPHFGSNPVIIAATVTAWLLLLSIVAYWRSLGGTRHLWSTATLLCVFVLAIAGTSFYLRDEPLASPNRAIVLKPEKLRANFTANSPTILSLKPGDAVEITSVNGPWTECLLPDKTLGWLATSSLERVIPQG